MYGLIHVWPVCRARLRGMGKEIRTKSIREGRTGEETESPRKQNPGEEGKGGQQLPV